jgi:hypothetical protein
MKSEDFRLKIFDNYQNRFFLNIPLHCVENKTRGLVLPPAEISAIQQRELWVISQVQPLKAVLAMPNWFKVEANGAFLGVPLLCMFRGKTALKPGLHRDKLL